MSSFSRAVLHRVAYCCYFRFISIVNTWHMKLLHFPFPYLQDCFSTAAVVGWVWIQLLAGIYPIRSIQITLVVSGRYIPYQKLVYVLKRHLFLLDQAACKYFVKGCIQWSIINFSWLSESCAQKLWLLLMT